MAHDLFLLLPKILSPEEIAALIQAEAPGVTPEIEREFALGLRRFLQSGGGAYQQVAVLEKSTSKESCSASSRRSLKNTSRSMVEIAFFFSQKIF